MIDFGSVNKHFAHNTLMSVEKVRFGILHLVWLTSHLNPSTGIKECLLSAFPVISHPKFAQNAMIAPKRSEKARGLKRQQRHESTQLFSTFCGAQDHRRHPENIWMCFRACCANVAQACGLERAFLLQDNSALRG
ncbi:MAG: hypothetical protein AAB336_09830 [Acidobacteriota bacterium]